MGRSAEGGQSSSIVFPWVLNKRKIWCVVSQVHGDLHPLTTCWKKSTRMVTWVSKIGNGDRVSECVHLFEVFFSYAKLVAVSIFPCPVPFWSQSEKCYSTYFTLFGHMSLESYKQTQAWLKIVNHLHKKHNNDKSCICESRQCPNLQYFLNGTINYSALERLPAKPACMFAS